MDLHGSGAMVTGGSGDLGAAICATLPLAACDVAAGCPVLSEKPGSGGRICRVLHGP